MDWITANWISIVGIVGAIVLGARIIVKITPTPKDDSILNVVVKFLKAVGLHVE